MNLIFKSPVWDDLREIGLRIAKDNPVAADRFFAAAKEAFEMLRRQPGLGRLRSFSTPGVRSWVIPSFRKYLVFYRPVRTEVQILAVLYGGRDFAGTITERLK